MVSIQTFWARLLLQKIIRDNGETLYRHTTGPVWWGKYDNKDKYISITDCSGFVNALLCQSFNLTTQDLYNWFGTKRPYASTYYKSFVDNNGFEGFYNLNNAAIGDFIAINFLPGTGGGRNTGHIVLIDGSPTLKDNSSPIINDTLQWIVPIIDQSSHHGTSDTRYSDKPYTGLGKGLMRFYTDKSGTLSGYTWSLLDVSLYINISKHPLIIGRLNNANLEPNIPINI